MSEVRNLLMVPADDGQDTLKLAVRQKFLCECRVVVIGEVGVDIEAKIFRKRLKCFKGTVAVFGRF
jgi:hypothetical protein